MAAGGVRTYVLWEVDIQFHNTRPNQAHSIMTHSRQPPGPDSSELSEPLLDAAAQPEEEQHLIKGVAGLWWRQGLLLLQAVLQTTLMAYALATDGEGTVNSPFTF